MKTKTKKKKKRGPHVKIKSPVLANAVKINREFPESFTLPDAEEIRLLKQGDFVKVCHNSERFWVEIMVGEQNTFIGRIANVLVSNLLGLGESESDIQLNDFIWLQAENIYCIGNGETAENESANVRPIHSKENPRE